MNIATHRFRGFDSDENTSTGFINALAVGVKYFEFDVRITADHIPVINHDFSTQNSFKSKLIIKNSNYDDLKRLKYHDSNAPGMMTLEECLDIFAEKNRDSSRIFIDIKDFGEEEQIYQMLKKRSLLHHSIIVSWLPEVLFAFHRIDSSLPLCFSHNFIQNRVRYFIEKLFIGTKPFKQFIGVILKPFNREYANFILNTDVYFEDYDRCELPESFGLVRAHDSEHTLCSPVSGRLFEIILESKGFVCINYRSIPKNYLQLYSKSPGLIPYSINSEREMESFMIKIKPDFVLSDNPALVSKFD